MAIRTLDAGQVRQALAVRDLTDPNHGPHAMQLLLNEVESALAAAWRSPSAVTAPTRSCR